MARLLVLGGSGFIGNNVIFRLLKSGHSVVNFDRPGTSPEQFHSSSHYRFVPGNLSDVSHLRNVFSQQPFDCVIHLVSSLIPSSGYDEFYADRDINLSAGYEIVRNMITNGCSRIIFFSSGGTVYGKNGRDVNREDDPLCPVNYYGYSKLAFEEFLRFSARQYPIQCTIIRPSNPYGSGQNLFGKQGLITVALGKVLLNQPIEIWGNGEVVRDYVHISDLSEAIGLLVEHQTGNEIFNIGSGIGVSVNEIVGAIREITGLHIDVVYKDSRPIDIPVNILSIEKISSVLGWKPSVPLHDGIRLLWNEMQLSSRHT